MFTRWRCLAAAWWAPVVLLAAVIASSSPAHAIGPPPVPDASAYLLVNPATGEVLAAEDADRRLPMASITKVMTAHVVLRRADLDEVATVPPEAAIGGSSAELVVGEEISVRHLLTGLLVASGNDAAVTLAYHVAGSQEAFVALMNERARAIGLEDTHFANPHGLDEPGHHSSARDLVRLGRVAMRDPIFAELVSHRTATIPGPGGEGVRELRSQNDLLSILPSADGIKTGHTAGAGYALLARAQRPRLGVTLYLASIGAPSEAARAEDAAALLRWGFAQYVRPTLLEEGEVIARAPVRDRPGVTLGFAVARTLRPPLRPTPDAGAITETIVAPAEVAAPVSAGQVMGHVVLRQGERVLGRRDLVAARELDAPSLGERVRAALGRALALPAPGPVSDVLG